MFRVLTTKEFDNRFDKLDLSERKRVVKILNQLRERGPKVGKPLGRDYLLEKKFKGKRLYFLFYKDFLVILAIAISNKKAQQETINKIISRLTDYKEFILKKLN